MRGHNEGSVYYWKERDRWVAEITTETGKRKKFLFKTKVEALKKKNEALRDLDKGVLAAGPQQKLGVYLEYWVENVYKDKVRISSYIKYKKLIRYMIEDKLGDVWLQKLTPEQVRQFYTRMGASKEKGGRGLASRTVNQMHVVLHMALDNAVKWNYVGKNVCDLVQPPRIVCREAVFLTLEQVQLLLDSLREQRLEVMVTMAIVTGMRRGELMALRWSNVDFEHQTVLILHTVDYIPYHGYMENEPKTKAGKRLISLPTFLVEMLKHHRVEQSAQRSNMGSKWIDHDLVFPNLQGGYFSPDRLLFLFKKALQKAGLPHMHFHDLRHSSATIMLGMGINPKVIQERLGHSNVSITLGLYSHLLPSMQKDVGEKWNGAFEKDEGEDV